MNPPTTPLMFFEEKRRRKDLTRRILPAGAGQSHWREALDEQMSSLSHSGRSHWEKNYFQTILCYLNTISLARKCW